MLRTHSKGLALRFPGCATPPMRDSKWNQLAQPLLAFLLATGFLLRICGGGLVLVSRSGLRLRTRLLDLIYLRRRRRGRCSFRRRSRTLAARSFLVGVWRPRTCAHGLHSNVLARLRAIELVRQIVDDRGRVRNRFLLQVWLADLACRGYVRMLL